MIMSTTRPVVIASANAGKIVELARILGPLGYQAIAQAELGVPSPEETGGSFLANALIKAEHAAGYVPDHPILADDSGLEVDALDGRPGVDTATLAGRNASDTANVTRLLELLAPFALTQRTARFVCCLVWIPTNHEGHHVFTGVCRGRITLYPRGSNGFGYDPVFEIPEYGLTLAELSPDIKDSLSHRGQALRQLKAFLTREQK